MYNVFTVLIGRFYLLILTANNTTCGFKPSVSLFFVTVTRNKNCEVPDIAYSSILCKIVLVGRNIGGRKQRRWSSKFFLKPYCFWSPF